MIKLRTLRTVILSTLLALLSVSFLTLTAGAQPVAPTHTGPGVSTRVVTLPLSNNPNSNIKLNKKRQSRIQSEKDCLQANSGPVLPYHHQHHESDYLRVLEWLLLFH